MKKYAAYRSKVFAPWFKKDINIKEGLTKAEIIVCGLGFYELFRVLAENAEIDTALKVLKNPTVPSYMQWIDAGETGLCESFSPASGTDSHNHHFWGNISAFFMQQICGIKVCADKIKCEPFVPSDMNEASASFESVFGRISASWKRENGKITYNITYPERAKEHIVLCVNGAHEVKICKTV